MSNDLSEFENYSEFALSPQAPEAHVTLDVPPQLVWECAAGLEDPDSIAARFGFEGAKWSGSSSGRHSSTPCRTNALSLSATG